MVRHGDKLVITLYVFFPFREGKITMENTESSATLFRGHVYFVVIAAEIALRSLHIIKTNACQKLVIFFEKW
jgi:hypothetical protein